MHYEEKTLKRLVIMAIYCPYGQFERYKVQLIDGIRSYADDLYVVCNGEISESAYSHLEQSADHVMVRANIGFDAGAYKDVISLVPMDEYDELLLMNDTFYGFFYSLDEFFIKVKENERIDFWGLTKHTKGEGPIGSFEEHIQSYFLLIKARMLHSKDFKQFWSELSYPETYQEAIRNFETRFTPYFKAKGFQYAAYCNLMDIGIEDRDTLSPYLYYPLELLQLLRCPVLKAKPRFYMKNFSMTKKILDYIDENLGYDVDLIYEHIEKNMIDKNSFNTHELQKFFSTYKRIYIYGHGKVAQNLRVYLEYRKWKYEGFIVSEKKENEEGVVEYKDMKFEKTDGIILALGRKALREVYPMIKVNVSVEQLLLPKYDDLNLFAIL